MRIWRLLLPLITAAAALAAACQGDPRAERIARKEVAINIGSDPRSLDPSLATDLPSTRALMFFTRGLTVLDERGYPRPELAERWTVSPDGLIYEIKLRPARWSTGEPVTAEDFVYAWTERMLNPKFGSEYAYQLFYLKGAREFYENPDLGARSVGVEALAPDRLRVTLAHPAPFFPTLLAHQSYYPVSRKADQANPDWSRKAETYVGCGPFLMTGYHPGYEITGRKNPAYWNAAAVAMEGITIRMIEQESTERIAFDNGEIDGSNAVPRADLDALRDGPELKFSPQYATYFLNLNCRKGVFKDVRVRRALALAIDRAAIAKNLTRGGERPALFITPPELYKQPPEPTIQDGQFEEARRLLAAAGHPGGAGLPTLRYIYNTMETHQQIAQVIQETWRRELGVRLEIQNQEFKVLLDNRRHGSFDIARNGWQADFADPINFLELFDSKSDNNDSFFEDPRYDALLAAARADADPVGREARLRQVETYLMEQMPVIPLYFQTQPYLAAPELEGYAISPMGLFDAARLRWAPARTGAQH